MEFTRTVERAFATSQKAVLHLEARSGAVAVETHGQPEVLVEAILRVWADHEVEVDEAALLVERGMSQDEQQRVIVRAPSLPQSEGWSFWGRRGARVDYNVRVPTQTAVRVLSRSGRIGVTGTQGRLHVESGSGRVQLQDIRGDLNVVTRSGAITIERVEGIVTAEARSGRIEVRMVKGNVGLQSRSGIIDVREVSGDLEARAHTGSITIDRPGGGVYARAHTGSIRFSGRVEGDVALSAQTGTVTMAVDPQQGFYLDAESDTGTVRSDLPPRRGGAAAPAEGGPKVRLRTHTGSIRLTRL
jgi:DUF4097 and DUF4098 domain-containing protein YvlB